jgi:hypothetical protein
MLTSYNYNYHCHARSSLKADQQSITYGCLQLQDTAHHLHVLLQLLALLFSAGWLNGWIVETSSSRDDFEEELPDGLQVVERL